MAHHIIAIIMSRFMAALLAVLLLVPLGAARAAAEDMRAVLITGATSGIGLKMTEVLSQKGFFIYAGARKPEDMERLNAMENVQSVRLDVTIQSDIDAAVAFVEAQGRGLYGLINNAGVSILSPLIETRESDMDFLMNVNLYGPYRITKAFAPLIIESEGRILNVTSIAGIVASPFSGVYSMSKHGLEAFTDSLAGEMARFNVAVAAVEPGNFKSKIVASMMARMDATGYSSEGSRYEPMRSLITGPLDRSQYKEPDAVALAAYDFLTSPAPKRRYMVVPNQAEADLTIRQALREVAQLNDDQPYSYSRDDLVAMLDEVLAAEAETRAAPAEAADVASLHEAAFTGNVAAIEAMVASGAELNAKDATGATPLIVATTFGQTGAAMALIAAGADLNASNNDGSTPLLIAALFCREEIVKALLDAGADKMIGNKAGSTPLDVVSMPFSEAKPTYDFLGQMLEPYGLTLDYARLEATRPKIAEMLR